MVENVHDYFIFNLERHTSVNLPPTKSCLCTKFCSKISKVHGLLSIDNSRLDC